MKNASIARALFLEDEFGVAVGEVEEQSDRPTTDADETDRLIDEGDRLFAKIDRMLEDARGCLN